jgi:hypothetical protein
MKHPIPKGATLRLEHVNCGRCPKQHGPYWYAYWQDYGQTRTRKLYIGKNLPPGTEAPKKDAQPEQVRYEQPPIPAEYWTEIRTSP